MKDKSKKSTYSTTFGVDPITEGFHRKMKLIQRLAYGYKNFEFKRSANEILP